MKFYHSQLGATLTELIMIGPIILGLGLCGVQYTLMYNAKTNLSYAAYEAARAGAIENADPDAIQAGLLKGLLPYLSASHGFDGDGDKSAQFLQTIAREESPYMRVEIVNPTADAYEDFNNHTLQKLLNTTQKVIPNKQTDLENLKNVEGAKSGLTIEEANVLKLRITYGYEPKFPVIKEFFLKGHSFLSGQRDAFNTMLFTQDRVPIVVDVSSQMLSPAVQNGLDTVDYDPGNTQPLPMGQHELPDLSVLNLPEKYEDFTREELYEVVSKGRDPSINDTDWYKILAAAGLVTIGIDQISGEEVGSNSFNVTSGLNGTEEVLTINYNQTGDIAAYSAHTCSFNSNYTYGAGYEAENSLNSLFDSPVPAVNDNAEVSEEIIASPIGNDMEYDEDEFWEDLYDFDEVFVISNEMRDDIKEKGWTESEIKNLIESIEPTEEVLTDDTQYGLNKGDLVLIYNTNDGGEVVISDKNSEVVYVTDKAILY